VWKVLDKEQQTAPTDEAKKQKVKLSVKGFADAPAIFRPKVRARQYDDNGTPNPEARVLGGVLVRDRIEREVVINLVALRGLRGKDETETNAIRKYLLGLSLLAATADIELFLREGCLLRYADSEDQWYEVPRRGEPTSVNFKLNAETARAYAGSAATHFRSQWPEEFKGKWSKESPELKYEFSLQKAKDLLAKKTAEEEPSPE
jgi:CRISPR-associated protein Csb1